MGSTHNAFIEQARPFCQCCADTAEKSLICWVEMKAIAIDGDSTWSWSPNVVVIVPIINPDFLWGFLWLVSGSPNQNWPEIWLKEFISWTTILNFLLLWERPNQAFSFIEWRKALCKLIWSLNLQKSLATNRFFTMKKLGGNYTCPAWLLC